ncbi:MAG: response regulator transcription factor [Bacteroidetes bacterium]|nr:response regulator transcription factor [Bacteroidota bacterium]
MKVLIVDDEPIAQDIMETYVSKIPDVQLVGKCRNALEAFQAINKEEVHLLLLDINMPEITGMDFVKTLKSPPLVIFTTAYSEYAIESYELNAVDYLLKPVSFERFLKAINKAQDILNHQQTSQQAVAAPDNIIFIKADNKLVRIDLKQLWFAEGLKDYVQLWTEGGKKIIHSTMKNLEDCLAPYNNFVRVQKSYIVNLEYISEVDGNSIRIKNQSIPIGSMYKEQVTTLLNKHRLV